MTMSSAEPDRSQDTVNFDKRAMKLDRAEDAEEIIDSISKHRGCLRTLILSGNTLGIEAGKAIGKALEAHKELTKALWSDMFTGRSKEVIAPALSGLSSGVILSGAQLVELDLRDNAFGPTGVVGVTELIGSRCCHTLKILRMDNEGLGHQGCRLLSEALTKGIDESEAAGKMMQLEVFTAGRNRLENEGMKMLSGVFQRMKSLRELALFQNGIGIHGIDGCEALARALSQNPNLTVLNLSDNSLTPKGIRVLVDCAFEYLTKVEVLNLSDCILRTKGARILADCFSEVMPSLRELYLSGNEIRREAAVSLILSLESKQNSLKILDLNTNEFGEDGIIDVQKTLTSIEMVHCLQSLSDDEGCGDDDDDNDEETYEEYDDDEEDEEEEYDEEEEEDEEEEWAGSAGTSRTGSKFSFKTGETSKASSLFEGLPASGFSPLFPNSPCQPERGLFNSPVKPAGTGLFSSCSKPGSLFDSSSKPSRSLFDSSSKPSGSLFNSSSKPSGSLFDSSSKPSGGLFESTCKPSGSFFNSPDGKASPRLTGGTSLFSDASGSQAKLNPLLSGEPSTTSSLFKAPGSLFGATTISSPENGAATIKPARFITPVSADEINRDIKQLLQNLKFTRETVQRLSSAADLTTECSKVIKKDTALVEAAVEGCVECAAIENGAVVCQSLLDAAVRCDATIATNHVLVQLGLIKGEKKVKRKLSSAQGQVVLNCIKDSIVKRSFPCQQAQLLSFFLSKGPQRPEADALRCHHKTEIEQLTKSVQEDLSQLKI